MRIPSAPTRLFLSLALGVVPCLLGCGAGREIVLGAVICESGEGAYYGQAIRQGMDLAVDQVNAAGGIGGNRIRILYRNSESRPDQAARAATDLYDRFDVPLIFGGVLSSETLAMAPLAERRHKILLSPASSSPEITRAGRYIFRVYPSDVLEGAYMAQLARDELRLETITILAIDNDFGAGLVGVFRRSFQGPEPRVIPYPVRGADYPHLAEQAAATGADGIYLVGYYNDMADLLRELRLRNVSARILSTSSFGNLRTLQKAGESAEGVIFPATVFDLESEDPAVSRFVREFRDRYRSDPDVWAAHGYDAVMVAAVAIEGAGTPVPDRIAAALLKVRDHRGASGPLSIDPEGDVVQYPRAHIVHRGRFVLYRDYLEERKRGPEATRQDR